MQSTIDETPSDATWRQLSPLLEEAMLRLGQADRDALVLRFFEGRSFNEVGSALGLSEDTAKKRVNRSVEKLQKFFLKRGINSTTAAISGAITANSVHAAPVTLAQAATAAALAKGATASTSATALIKGALKIMTWAQAKTALIVGSAIILAAGSLAIESGYQKKSQIDLPAEKWKFAGYGDPVSAFQTLFWYIVKHDGKNVFASLSPECQQEFREFVAQTAPGVPAEEFCLQKGVSSIEHISSIRIIETEVLSTNQILLNIRVYARGGGDSGYQWLKLKRVGDEWKVDDFDPKGRNSRTGLDHPNARYGGIGATVDFDPVNRAPRITRVQPGSAALRDGLSSGLLLGKINGTSTAGRTLAESVFLTRGRIGTSVVLEVFDPKLKQTNTVELTRERLRY